MITAIRILLGLVGVWFAYLGIAMILPYRPVDLISVAVWFAGGIILHDFVFAPLCAVVGLGARRLLPRSWWAPLAYGVVCTVVLVALSIPVLVPHNTFGNPTVVDRNYPLGLGISVGIVWIVVCSALFRSRLVHLVRVGSNRALGARGEIADAVPVGAPAARDADIRGASQRIVPRHTDTVVPAKESRESGLRYPRPPISPMPPRAADETNRTDMDPNEYRRTLRSLHGVAELLLAGPQYRTSGTIRLRPAPGGFATTAAPRLAMDGDILRADGAEIGTVSGVTYAALATAAGVSAGAPREVYADGSGSSPQDTIEVDPACARVIATAFDIGDRALRAFAPAQTPVLWPEHFDLAVSVGEVNYGVSPGDASIGEPYAYVGPWTPREGPFWNVSFGAARTLAELTDADGVRDFFAAGAREV